MPLYNSFRDSLVKGDCKSSIKKFFGDKPLLSALKHGEYENCPLDIIKLMLDQGEDVNCVDEIGYSPLALALKYKNNEEVTLELLERGAEVNKLCCFGRTPLLVLLQRENCSVAIVQLLLRYGAEVNCMDEYKDSVLATAIRKPKDDSIMQVLLEAGAKVDKGSSLNNNPLLILLRRRKKCSGNMVKLFLKYGADVNCEDERGYSPLAIAIQCKRSVAVIHALLEGGANVNKVFKYGETPLSLLLQSSHCSVEAVQLLLDYKANVNYVDENGNSSLKEALIRMKGEKIIRALLDNGASVNTLDHYRKSPLCYAFRYASNDVVKMLLDAGSARTCDYHGFALLCALDDSKSGLREDILERLLEGHSTDLDSIAGQSLLCYALHGRAKVRNIELLLEKGASLSACRRHKTPLMCASSGALLREGVVKLLLDRGAGMEDVGWEIMEGALRWGDYEVGAIQLLLDLPGMVDCIVTGKENKESILHIAVSNHHCKLGAVELLVSRISQVHRVIKEGETLLHCAVENKECLPGIIKLLLKSGFPVNEKNKTGITPLVLVVRNGYNCDVMKELLIAGAQIGEEKCCNGYTLLESVLRQYDYDTDEKTLNWFKILVKFFFLQNPQYRFVDCQRVSYGTCRFQRTWNLIKFSEFSNNCLGELQKMKSIHIGNDFTLSEFVRGYCLPDQLSDDCASLDSKNYNLKQLLRNMAQKCNESSSDCKQSEVFYYLDQLLGIMADNEFTVYFDVLLARVERSVMEIALPKLKVYAVQKGPDAKKIYLNEDMCIKISSFLSDEHLLRFILVFYNPQNDNESGHRSENNKSGAKRSLESSTKLKKIPKLY